MKGQRPISVIKLFSAKALSAGGASTSEIVDLRSISQEGRFSVHAAVSGSGTVKAEYLVAAEEAGTFIKPAGASDVLTGATSGNYAANFTPVLSPFIKIKITETGGAQTATVSLWLVVQ